VQNSEFVRKFKNKKTKIKTPKIRPGRTWGKQKNGKNPYYQQA
jgi:hypothetical protein